MVFSSVSFLYYFIPCVMIFYFMAPASLKNVVLLFSSLFFYAWGEPKYLFLLLFSITQGYLFARLIEKYRAAGWSRFFLTVSVSMSLGFLLFFKYADFLIDNFNGVTGLSVPLLKIPLPIGISFYTFQLLGYVVDVYQGREKAEKSYVRFAVYLTMFPQLIAGPIVRYTDIAGELEKRQYRLEDISAGIWKFAIGLSKKVLIADVLGSMVSAFWESGDKSVLFFWMYAVCCALQIYFDFSGYSDMAIGLGRIFGFHIPKNFDYPYAAGSMTEFWRRWHISLGTWFRDYLYIPLGGNRLSRQKWFRNILLVWAATGLWHGAAWNFVLWGVFFAVFLIVEKLWLLKVLKKWKLLNHIYVLLFVTVSFVIFDSADIQNAFYCIRAMFFAAGLPVVSTAAVYYLKSYAVVFAVAILGATPLPAKLIRRGEKSSAWQAFALVAEPLCLVLLFLVCTAFLVDGSFQPFLYFRF